MRLARSGPIPADHEMAMLSTHILRDSKAKRIHEGRQ
jgi:hypothetical protein